MIIVDGNDGTGKSTLVNSLRRRGYQVQDRGLPSLATDDLDLARNLNEEQKKNTFIILDAPVEICQKRLKQAGKDLTEKYHTIEDLTHYREQFRKVADILNVPLFNAWDDYDGTALAVLVNVLDHIGHIDTITLGLPKGRLLDPSLNWARSKLIHFELSDRNYTPICYGSSIDSFMVKPKSIPQMVAYGIIQCGFCSEDIVLDSEYADDLEIVSTFGDKVRLSAIADHNILEKLPNRPLRIATEYPNIASKWATNKNLAHLCINTHGSTEAWVPRFADIAVDIVQSGNTIAANGLIELEIIRDVQPCLIIKKQDWKTRERLLNHQLFLDKSENAN